MSRSAVLFAILVFLFMTSCGSSSSSNSSDASGTVSDNAVTIQGFAFSPSTLTVAAGTTVTWTNSDGINHTVTSGLAGGSDAGSVFDSGTILNGQTFSFKFTSAGTYNYYCTIHPSMTGTITVE